MSLGKILFCTCLRNLKCFDILKLLTFPPVALYLLRNVNENLHVFVAGLIGAICGVARKTEVRREKFQKLKW